MRDDETQGQCPTPTAHKWLEEAHRVWHECLDQYQDPEGNFLEPLRVAWRAAGFGESTHSEQDENG